MLSFVCRLSVWLSVTIVNCGQTMRDRHITYYGTIKHWELVDIGLSESAKKLTLNDPEEVISRSRKYENGPYRLNGWSAMPN